MSLLFKCSSEEGGECIESWMRPFFGETAPYFCDQSEKSLHPVYICLKPQSDQNCSGFRIKVVKWIGFSCCVVCVMSSVFPWSRSPARPPIVPKRSLPRQHHHPHLFRIHSSASFSLFLLPNFFWDLELPVDLSSFQPLVSRSGLTFCLV